MLEKIDIPKLLDRYNVPGVSISLIENYKVLKIANYGFASIEDKQPVTKNTVFQIASISKPISTWGVMKLVEKDLIDLDAPIENYLKKWHLPPSKFNHDKITMRRLLSHTAGLSLHGYSGFHPDHEKPSIVDSLSGNIKYQKDAIQLKIKEIIKSDPKEDERPVTVFVEPGTQFSYSGGGYTIAQLIVEEITDQNFAEYMENEILKPLGMNQSSFSWREDLKPLTAKAYFFYSEIVPNYLFTALAAAGCYSTTVDLSKFVLASMKGSNGELPGRGILKPETIEMMHKIYFETKDPLSINSHMGLGYFIMPLNGYKIVNHSGGNIGWNTQMMFIPESGDGLIVFTNGQNGIKLTLTLTAKWLKHVEKKLLSK